MNTYSGQKAVIYARYSSHNQTEQSIEGQLRDAYSFADRNGITVISEYIDRAQSGTSDDRPAFQRMIRDAEKHQFTLVLVWKFDRFARNRYDSASNKRKLSKCGVRVVSVMEPISEGSEGILIESVLEGFAEYYSRNLGENVKRGQRESVLKGWFPGGNIPFGYVHQDHHLVPDPRLVPIVKEIFDRYSSGIRVKQIIDDLASRGITYKQGTPFTYNVIARMLDNPTYIGEFRFNGQTVAGCAAPIVDRSVFEKAAAIRARNRQAPAAGRKPDVRFILLGKLFCGECGLNMLGDTGTSRTGTPHHYYTCRGKKNRLNGCGMKSVRKDEIEYAVCRVISDFLLNKSRRTLDDMAESFYQICLSEIDTSEVSDLESRLRCVDRDLNKLVDSLIEMPASARPMIAKRMDALDQQKKDIESKLSRARLLNDTCFSRDDFARFLQVTMEDLDVESNRVFIIERFLNAVHLYSDGRMVVYLNHFPGLPHLDPDTDRTPGTDAYKSGKPITLSKGLPGLPSFVSGSSLYSYALPAADKGEPTPPLLFFLHGKVGIVVSRQRLHQ